MCVCLTLQNGQGKVQDQAHGERRGGRAAAGQEGQVQPPVRHERQAEGSRGGRRPQEGLRRRRRRGRRGGGREGRQAAVHLLRRQEPRGERRVCGRAQGGAVRPPVRPEGQRPLQVSAVQGAGQVWVRVIQVFSFYL